MVESKQARLLLGINNIARKHKSQQAERRDFKVPAELTGHVSGTTYMEMEME